MNYHNITKEDMLNGDGLRVVLWVSGCSHKCKGCHNPQTWDANSGIPFDEKAKEEIFEELEKDFIDGITFSGGDPLNENNLETVNLLIDEIRQTYPTKTIWLYSGYTYAELDAERKAVVDKCNVFVDGKFVEELADVNYPWAGSTNQIVHRISDCSPHIVHRF